MKNRFTPKQKKILDFITKYLDKNDYAPSLDEIRRHFKLRAISTVHQHIQALEKKGYLFKTKFQVRSITII